MSRLDDPCGDRYRGDCRCEDDGSSADEWDGVQVSAGVSRAASRKGSRPDIGAIGYNRGAAVLLSLALSACCPPPTTVPHAVVITPPPCLGQLPPDPPQGEDDAAWVQYRVRMESWAAYVVRACGGHLTGAVP